MKLNRDKKRYYANAKKVIGHYKIATPEETIEEIINENRSIARYGDGEFDFIYGIGMNYQKYNEKLAKRLKEVLKSNEKDLLIGIPNVVNLEYCNEYTGIAIEFWPKWINKYKFKLLKILDKKRQYYSAQISRFYLDYKDKSNKAEYVKKIKKIWDKRMLLLLKARKVG